jgi:glyoxylase-like metal-dependent hydrolase (beta-lactamase superfamily II)
MSYNIKIHILQCGEILVDRAVPFSEKTWNLMAFTGLFRSRKKQLLLPVSAYLIEHPKGIALIDTGWHTDVKKNPKKHLGWAHYLVNKPFLPDGQAINEQLESLGYKDTDIDYLVLSHLHTDHVSGLQLVRNAKRILVSEQEWKSGNRNKIMYRSFMWENVDIETIKFTDSQYGHLGKSYDLFGDDTVLLVNTPGHTKGLITTMIQNNGKFVLLCSDTGYAEKSWKKMILPGLTSDKAQAVKSLEWIKGMSEKPNCKHVIANHNLDIDSKTIEL